MTNGNLLGSPSEAQRHDNGGKHCGQEQGMGKTAVAEKVSKGNAERPVSSTTERRFPWFMAESLELPGRLDLHRDFQQRGAVALEGPVECGRQGIDA